MNLWTNKRVFQLFQLFYWFCFALLHPQTPLFFIVAVIITNRNKHHPSDGIKTSRDLWRSSHMNHISIEMYGICQLWRSIEARNLLRNIWRISKNILAFFSVKYSESKRNMYFHVKLPFRSFHKKRSCSEYDPFRFHSISVCSKSDYSFWLEFRCNLCQSRRRF